MKTGLKDSKQVLNLVNNIKFNPTNVGDYVFLSDVIKVPIFIFNHSSQWEAAEILESNRRFIDTFCSALTDKLEVISHEDNVTIRECTDGVAINYMAIIEDIVNRTGPYKDQHDLMFQLTHYTSSFTISLRVGLLRDEGSDTHLVPSIVAALKLEARNKFDKKLTKILELDTVKLSFD